MIKGGGNDLLEVMKNSEEFCDALESDRIVLLSFQGEGKHSSASDFEICDENKCRELLIYDISSSERKYTIVRDRVILKTSPIIEFPPFDFYFSESGEEIPLPPIPNTIRVPNSLLSTIGDVMSTYLYDTGMSIHSTKLKGSYYCDRDEVIYQLYSKNEGSLLNFRNNSPLLLSAMAQTFFHHFILAHYLGVQQFDSNRGNVMFTSLSGINSFAGVKTKGKKFLKYYLPPSVGVDELIVEVIDDKIVKLIDFGGMAADLRNAIPEFNADLLLIPTSIEKANYPLIPPEKRKWLLPNGIVQLSEGINDQTLFHSLRHFGITGRKSGSITFNKIYEKILNSFRKEYHLSDDFLSFVPGRSGVGECTKFLSVFLSNFETVNFRGKKVCFITKSRNYSKIYYSDSILEMKNSPVSSRFLMDGKIINGLNPFETLPPSYFIEREKNIFSSPITKIDFIDVYPKMERKYFLSSSVVNPTYQKPSIEELFERICLYSISIDKFKKSRLFFGEELGEEVERVKKGLILNTGYFVVDNNIKNLLLNNGTTPLIAGTPIGVSYSNGVSTNIPFPPIYNKWLALIIVRKGEIIVVPFEEVLSNPLIEKEEHFFKYHLGNGVIFTRRIEVPSPISLAEYYDADTIFQSGPYIFQSGENFSPIRREEFVITEDDVASFVEMTDASSLPPDIIGKKYHPFLYRSPKGKILEFNNHYLFHVPEGSNVPTLYGMNFDNVVNIHNILIQTRESPGNSFREAPILQTKFLLFPGRGFGNYGIDRKTAVDFILNEFKNVENIVFLDGGFSANAIVVEKEKWFYLLPSPERKVGTGIVIE